MTLALDLTRYALITGFGAMAVMSSVAPACLLAIGALWIKERFA